MDQNTNCNAGADEYGGYQIVRVFAGERTAEQVVADLIKVHLTEAGSA